MPADKPLTTPPVLTVAKDVLLLLHVPPVVVSESVIVEPVHTTVPVPVIVPAEQATVIMAVPFAGTPLALQL